MDIKGLMSEEIKSELELLSDLEVGTDEYKSTVDSVTKLTDRVIEMEKLEVERLDKVESRKNDIELKQKQMKDEKIDRYIKNGLTLFSTVGGWILIRWGAKSAWKFEETGSITSGPGRKFMDMIFRK